MLINFYASCILTTNNHLRFLAQASVLSMSGAKDFVFLHLIEQSNRLLLDGFVNVRAQLISKVLIMKFLMPRDAWIIRGRLNFIFNIV